MSVFTKFKLDGKIALVTGGASGIGLACATAVAEAGADVAMVDVNAEGAHHAAQKLSQETGRKVIALTADVSKEEDTERMVAETVKQLGGLNICFANAGIAEHGVPLIDFEKQVWDQVIGINLTGVFLTNRAAARVMVKQKSGSIINTASIYGLIGDNNLGGIFAYSAAKGGVVQMTKTLAVQLAPLGIRVNAIAPQFTRGTNIADGILHEDQTDPEVLALHQELVRRTPMGRFGHTEDLKGMALFLASEASSFCTGYTYAVDGGWVAY